MFCDIMKVHNSRELPALICSPLPGGKVVAYVCVTEQCQEHERKIGLWLWNLREPRPLRRQCSGSGPFLWMSIMSQNARPAFKVWKCWGMSTGKPSSALG